MTFTIASSNLRRSLGASRARGVGLVLLAVLVASLWVEVGPVALGGRSSYVVTSGTSMLPHFKANGLVITRRESEYHVGEVVAYHNRQLGEVVMHRIVAMDGNRYVFKGDNNSFKDQYHATRADLIGEEWIYWPGGGRYLNMLRNPATFAIAIVVVTLLAFLMPSRSRRRRRHHAQT